MLVLPWVRSVKTSAPTILAPGRRPSAGLREPPTGVELTEDDVIDSPHVFLGFIDRLVQKLPQGLPRSAVG